MGGGKSSYSRAGDYGQTAAYQSGEIARKVYEETQPYRTSFLNEYQNLMSGNMPFSQTGYAPMISAAREPIEAQYDVARGNVLANTPQGGRLEDQLTNVETARASSLGNLTAQYVMDLINKGYGAGMNAPAVSISGLQGPMQLGAAGWQAAEQGAAARSNFCCFIFCATDPKDELLEFVRRYKDSHYDIDSNVAQGYKRLALWWVPPMRKHPWFKKTIKFIMVAPMEQYAKAHYEEKRLIKFALFPIAHFWTLVYSFIGNYYGLRDWIQYWRLIDRW